MKRTIIACALVASLSMAAPHVSKNGWVEFYSKTPMETIQATTSTAVSKFDPETGGLSIRMRNTTFTFPNKLMQEHFNENYMESEKYPVSGFDGTVKGLDVASLEAGKKVQVMADGILDIHGVKKHRSIPATLWKLSDGTIHGESVFPVKLVEHDIKIPSLLTKKFAEEMRVTAKFDWKPEVKK